MCTTASYQVYVTVIPLLTGIGIQGLADTFQKMWMPFESPMAKKLNKEIFETIYFGALDASCELAEVNGPYESYVGSPVSKGILQVCRIREI